MALAVAALVVAVLACIGWVVLAVLLRPKSKH